MTITKNVQDAMLSWMGRGMLAILTLLTYFIYIDVKEFAASQQSIKIEQAVQKQELHSQQKNFENFKSETTTKFETVNGQIDVLRNRQGYFNFESHD